MTIPKSRGGRLEAANRLLRLQEFHIQKWAFRAEFGSHLCWGPGQGHTAKGVGKSPDSTGFAAVAR